MRVFARTLRPPGQELRGRLRELAAVYRMAETAVAEEDVDAILAMGM